ncbi:MAG: hypothetical protein LBE13_18765 [Bacteroidales bacterium]|jgi:hypothetical protein|nr:hypothetical protein [Bacteroidales bacterium]
MFKLQLLMVLMSASLIVVDGSAMNNEEQFVGGNAISGTKSLVPNMENFNFSTKDNHSEVQSQEMQVTKTDDFVNSATSSSDLLLDKEFIAKLDGTLSEESKSMGSPHTENFLREYWEKFKKNNTETTCFQLACARIMFLHMYGKDVVTKDIHEEIRPRWEEIKNGYHSIHKGKLQQARSSIEQHSKKIFIMSVIGDFISDLISEK